MTEQFDPRPSRYPWATRLLGWERRNQRAIDQTLANLVEWAADRSEERRRSLQLTWEVG